MFQRPIFLVALVLLLAGCENSINAEMEDVHNQEIAARDSAIAAREQAIYERDQTIAERDQRIAKMDQAIEVLAQEIAALVPHVCSLIGIYDGYMEVFEIYEDQQGILVVMGVPRDFFDLSPRAQQHRSEVIGTINALQYLDNALTLEECVSERKYGSEDAKRIMTAMNLLGTIQGGMMSR